MYFNEDNSVEETIRRTHSVALTHQSRAQTEPLAQKLFGEISGVFENTQGVRWFPLSESLGLWLVLRAACRAAMDWSLRVYRAETARVVRVLVDLHLADQVLEGRRRSLGCVCGGCWIENLEDGWDCHARCFGSGLVRRIHF